MFYVICCINPNQQLASEVKLLVHTLKRFGKTCENLCNHYSLTLILENPIESMNIILLLILNSLRENAGVFDLHTTKAT